MTIPWGDVSTAYASTGIANIEVFIPGSPAMIANARRANYIRWLLGLAPVQRVMKNRIAPTVTGPSASQPGKLVTHVWGEAPNAARATTTSPFKVPKA